MNVPVPNIVLIVVDQWRADAFSHLGHPTVETPNLDTLAMQSTSFQRAYAAVPSCIGARAGLMTGLTQGHHGRVGYEESVPWTYQHTIAELLSAGGYHTHCAGKLHAYQARNLLGFHSVDLHDGYTHVSRDSHANYGLVDDYERWLQNELGVDRDIAESGLGCNGYTTRPFVDAERYHPMSWVTARGIDFLRRRDPTKPFFLNLSYHRPHPPFDPPHVFWEMMRDKPLPEIHKGDWAPSQIADRFIDSPVPKQPALIDKARRGYFALITFLDNQLSRLIHSLIEHRVWNDTVVLFVSDHGELLYDHNLVAKAVPYEASARVPLMLRLPPKHFGSVVASVEHTVELRDVLPTLCEAGGVTIPDSIDGRSLLSLARDGESDSPREYIHGEHYSGTRSNQFIVTSNDKYIWFSQTGEEQYFDNSQDPHELHNAVGENAERVAHLRQCLIRELRGREEGFENEGRLVVGRPQGPTLSSTHAPGQERDDRP